MITLLALFVVGGTLLVSLSIPLHFEKVPPNPVYGFRLPQTLDDPVVWYATNKYSAKWLMWSGASIALAAVALYFIPAITLDAYALGCLAVFAVVFAVGLVQSVRYMRFVAQRRDGT